MKTRRKCAVVYKAYRNGVAERITAFHESAWPVRTLRRSRLFGGLTEGLIASTSTFVRSLRHRCALLSFKTSRNWGSGLVLPPPLRNVRERTTGQSRFLLTESKQKYYDHIIDSVSYVPSTEVLYNLLNSTTRGDRLLFKSILLSTSPA